MNQRRKKVYLSVHFAGGQLFPADLDDLQQVAADGDALLFPGRDGELCQLGEGVGQLCRLDTRYTRSRHVERLLRDHVVLVLVQRLEQRDGRWLLLVLLQRELTVMSGR